MHISSYLHHEGATVSAVRLAGFGHENQEKPASDRPGGVEVLLTWE
jgi:hypothetical protein